MKIVIFLGLFRKLTVFESLGFRLGYWAGFFVLKIFVKKVRFMGLFLKITVFLLFIFFSLIWECEYKKGKKIINIIEFGYLY